MGRKQRSSRPGLDQLGPTESMMRRSAPRVPNVTSGGYRAAYGYRVAYGTAVEGRTRREFSPADRARVEAFRERHGIRCGTRDRVEALLRMPCAKASTYGRNGPKVSLAPCPLADPEDFD